MASPFGRACVIVNPRAGRGAVERHWPAVRAVLDEGGVEYDVTLTERRGHGTEAARRAIDAGCRFLVAFGGDGTVHEVVNGMMDDGGPRNSGAVLGVVAAGSGCDFVKTFGLPQDPGDAARHLLGDMLWGKIDVARVRYTAADGTPATRWFANIAEAGLGAEVVDAAGRMPKWLGGTVYKIAALKSILRYKAGQARVGMRGRKARGATLDAPLEEIRHEGPLTMLVVANCQFFGGGMRVAPRAIPGDGLLDVQIAHGSKTEAVKTMQRMLNGSHVPSRHIAEFLATRVTLEGDDPILIEADGEVLGTSPATFDVLPEAIPMKV